MESVSAIGLVLLVLIFLTSYYGFRNQNYFEQHAFKVDEILIGKEYKRLISSGFLHSGWSHLIFNALALNSFSDALEPAVGITQYLVIFFSGLIGGNLFALYIHRNHGDYSAVGISGAVCALIFASIAVFPGMEIGFLFLPYSIPGWAYGLLFVLVSIYGIKAQRDNIGHEAHLGGGLLGMIIALIFNPENIVHNLVPIACIFLPSVIFLVFIVVKPEFLFIPDYFSRKEKFFSHEEKFNSQKFNREKELNRLLEKIHQHGYESLSRKEKEMLKELSINS